jgi:Ser-tRNA(Ala) deacylase AlaX
MELSRCQSEDAYFRRETAVVADVREAGDEWEVVLDDTIFYPEGGGQPGDRGRLGPGGVLEVRRDEHGVIVHRVDVAPEQGAQVQLEVDWSRRFDFMQQHTAQHLLTAIADDEFGFATTSFHLGDDYSAIELDTEALSAGELEALEARGNEEIRGARDVRFRFVDRTELDAESIRSRRLPDELGDEIRLVEIDGIDLNTCGGTHVRSTAELQCIKLLGTESARGGTRLSYLAGGRVVDWMDAELARHESLNSLLSCGPDDYVDSVSKLIDDAKSAERDLRSAREELSARLGRALARENGRMVVAHRAEEDFKFLESVAQSALDVDGTDVVLLTASQKPTGEGIFLLASTAEFVDEVGDDIAEILEGRGGGRPGRYQGRANAVEKREDAVAELRSRLP